MLFTKNFAFVCVCVCVSVTVTKAGKVKYAQKLKATWVCEKQKHAKNLVALFDFDFIFAWGMQFYIDIICICIFVWLCIDLDLMSDQRRNLFMLTPSDGIFSTKV